MKRSVCQRFLVLVCALILIISGAVFTPSSKVQADEEPVFEEVSVHDPSVLKVDDTYYVFGSHLAAAKTKDFMKWEQIANEVNPENPLFENVVEELKETFDWSQSDTLWAADVIQLEDGKFYMYYNACKGDSPRSAMGIAVSDSVEGPYEDLGIILKSGMWDEESEDGTIYDATVHPNAVDPDVFFDAEGKLWMTYGSYSGGIFILELDAKTGKPLKGQGYGKKLLGGNHSRIEASYIQYSQETDYYYMYLSFGGLDATGGYNMRVVRSENPDGPYVDAEGNDMINVKADPSLPLFDDASIEPYGVKIMGNFLFERMVGEPGTGNGTGYVSPGHNSVYYDEKKGEQYLIFHTRFPDRGEQHEVRVHKMYMNSQGWPVVSPYRYAGETLETVTEAEVSGDYKFINHGKDISAEIKKSVLVSLDNDGTITGSVNGTWELSGEQDAVVTIDGKTYNGVFVRQWNPTTESYTMTLTAQSTEGTSIWGSQMEGLTDEEVVENVKNNLSLGDTSQIISNITLPTEGYRDTKISWQSSNPEIVTNKGDVKRPTGGENVSVTLTATIAKGEYSETKEFTITVLPQKEGELVAHYAFEGNLEDQTGHSQAGTVTGNRIDNTGGANSYTAGKVGQAAVLDGASGIRLPNGIIATNKYTVSFWLNPEELTDNTTTFFGARNSDNWVSIVPRGGDWVSNNTMLWSTNDGIWTDGNTNVKIPENEWSHFAFTVDNGKLDVYINGVNSYTQEGFGNVFTTTDGVFGLGVNFWDQPFKGKIDELLIYESMALSADEIASYVETGAIPGSEQPETSDNDNEQTPDPDEGDADNGETNQEQNENDADNSGTTPDTNKGDANNSETTNGSKNELPDTATNSTNLVLIGVCILVLGIGMFLFIKRRHKLTN
ncbi:family 43 glycosylhydrolase [Metabacillus halosaccharovorans]|uniref:family 43 glycosylhydrolase n=1 Tax=Metabacillus halosaccharovorans TaxID=930124 RepID=UPI001C1FECE1|nr:family 43 glycosylhydrolase [Metabacillus halosaccharovorans]MBU7594304.1 family 43 glycosylhydrolase [Metabacillus halosaccharovorans]